MNPRIFMIQIHPEIMLQGIMNIPAPEFNQDEMIKIATMKMPFGRFKGTVLIDLPEPYVVWFYNQGLPDNELGRLLAQLYDIKLNGLEYLFAPLKNKE